MSLDCAGIATKIHFPLSARRFSVVRFTIYGLGECLEIGIPSPEAILATRPKPVDIIMRCGHGMSEE